MLVIQPQLISSPTDPDENRERSIKPAIHRLVNRLAGKSITQLNSSTITQLYSPLLNF